MTTLTDRYVSQVVRALPARQRADIEAELRGMIADGIDDRLEQGQDAAAAERDIITDLGAPARLAASYSDRQLALIGPELYVDYVRVLKLLLSTVVPLGLLVVGIISFVGGADVLAAMGAALVAAVQLAVAIAFFTTLVFAVVDRSPRLRARRAAAWDAQSLPEVVNKRSYWGELVGGLIFFGVITTALIVAQTVGAAPGPDGTPVGPIAPELWASGILSVAFLFAVASVSFHISAYYTGWSTGTAIATTVLGVLFVVPAVWLAASGRLFDPDYFEAVGWAHGAQFLAIVVIVVVLVLALMDSVDAWAKAVRARRG